MAATVEICESNKVTETITHSVTDIDMGNADDAHPTLDPVASPITPGNNSFEKWLRFHVTAMGGSSKIDNLQVWGQALGANATHKTNARTASYGGAQTFATPSATDRSATYGYTQTMPTADPAAANLGIAGVLTGSLTATGYSDYLVMQIQTTSSAIAGNTTTMSFQYDETA